MYHSQWEWFQLYEAILAYEGEKVFSDLLEPWTVQHAEELHWLAEFAARPSGKTFPAASGEDRCRLYAPFRVASILLLRFQSPRKPGEDWPGPPITLAEFQRFWEACGFRAAQESAFHPFYHEIVAVQPAADSAAPVEIVRECWPALLLGEMLFLRAGCVVRGGRDHVVPEIAERSHLYWTFCRRDRPCSDPSCGWGHNSQWRTAFRRDYRTAAGFHFNVDGTPVERAPLDPQEETPVETLRELIRFRALVRTAVPDDSDFYPYPYSCFEPRNG